MIPTVAEAIASARARLAPIGAAHEARVMLGHILGCDGARLLLMGDQTLGSDKADQFEILIRERLRGKPLQYLLGEWEFMGLPMIVREGALIPRADTEVLAERALMLARERGYRTALDLCTGSGCIAVSLAKIGELWVTATDVSEAALALATQNSALNGVDAKVRCVKSDLFSSVEGMFDLIVSNPPYIPSADIKALMPEVREHEPRIALDGGEDGLDFYRIIARDAPKTMGQGSALLVECGAGQAADVAELFAQANLKNVELYRDLNGIERVVKVEKADKE